MYLCRVTTCKSFRNHLPTYDLTYLCTTRLYLYYLLVRVLRFNFHGFMKTRDRAPNYNYTNTTYLVPVTSKPTTLLPHFYSTARLQRKFAWKTCTTVATSSTEHRGFGGIFWMISKTLEKEVSLIGTA